MMTLTRVVYSGEPSSSSSNRNISSTAFLTGPMSRSAICCHLKRSRTWFWKSRSTTNGSLGTVEETLGNPCITCPKEGMYGPTLTRDDRNGVHRSATPFCRLASSSCSSSTRPGQANNLSASSWLRTSLAPSLLLNDAAAPEPGLKVLEARKTTATFLSTSAAAGTISPTARLRK